MALREKLKRDLEEDPINKGAPVKADQKEIPLEWTTLCLRIPKVLSYGVDDALKSRYSMSKTAWILEAIREKLEKDLA